jgi:hypothetical protein
MKHEAHIKRADALLYVYARPLVRILTLTQDVSTFDKEEHNALNRMRAAMSEAQSYRHNVATMGKDHLSTPNMRLLRGALDSIFAMRRTAVQSASWSSIWDEVIAQNIPPALAALEQFEAADLSWRNEREAPRAAHSFTARQFF